MRQFLLALPPLILPVIGTTPALGQTEAPVPPAETPVMEGAEEALEDGDLAEAIDRQAEAMDALRDGMRNLGQALAENAEEQPGQGEAQGNATGRPTPGCRDPLGRQAGNTGQFGTEENLLQGEDVYRRAEELLRELRDRSSDQERPQIERDYLDRLLDRF